MDKCPSCGSSDVRLVICGSDQYGTIREWSCFQEGCLWTESEGISGAQQEKLVSEAAKALDYFSEDELEMFLERKPRNG